MLVSPLPTIRELALDSILVDESSEGTLTAMTPESAIVELRRAIPSFTVDSELEGLSYPIFNDFARFICSEAEILQYLASEEEALRLSKVPACMTFLEHVLQEGDSPVHDLVSECVETLSACPRQEQIKKWIQPKVAAIWKHQQ